MRAAWAAVDGAALPPAEAAPALANLALLLSAHGQSRARDRDVATRALGGASGDRQRQRRATTSGVELQSVGREREAVAALRAAAAGQSTAFDDEGPAIAPAARDRLADLGVASDPDSGR